MPVTICTHKLEVLIRYLMKNFFFCESFSGKTNQAQNQHRSALKIAGSAHKNSTAGHHYLLLTTMAILLKIILKK